LVILTKDDIPDLDEILVTWGSPGHQHASSFQHEGNDLVLEMILGAPGEVVIQNVFLFVRSIDGKGEARGWRVDVGDPGDTLELNMSWEQVLNRNDIPSTATSVA
jgi:hypothetical protein